MNKLKAFIIEDEKHIREYLQTLMARNFFDKVELCGTAGSILEAMEFLKRTKVDLLLLDIELADGQVFDLLKNIDYKKYKLIFITGYSEHAIKAIKFSAVDYLLKPIVTSEFNDAVNRVLNEHPQDDPVLNDIINRRQFDLADYLLINNQHAIEKISIEKISYLEADGVYTMIYHDSIKTISSKPIGVYEDILSSKLFNRCHKSYIVNKFYIKRISKGRGMEITLFDGKILPVAIRKKEEFNSWFRG